MRTNRDRLRAQFHGAAPVVLLATATAWAVSGLGLELLAGSEWSSILWIPLAHVFLGLAAVAATVGFALRILRSWHMPRGATRIREARWPPPRTTAAAGARSSRDLVLGRVA